VFAHAAATASAESPAWLEDLNAEQRAAATHPGGPLLVLAGAGTGKTTTLCARVAWLVSEGVAPERILLLTFTRRAAREMLQRTRTLVPMPAGSAGLLGGTFHSLAHRFARLHASALGLAPGFGVLDAGDAADLLDLVREEHGHAQSKWRFPKKATLLDIYSRTVNSQQQLTGVVAEHYPWCEEHTEAMAGLFKAYSARKRALGVLDLDDLLLYWRALAADDVIGPAMEDSFDHVLIDEYQDVNGLQVDIVRALRARRRDVTAVGDDFQAIYGWRAASAEHILRFPDHFEEAAVITLERNYRSTQPILDTSNAVAAQASRAFPKELRAEREGGMRPELLFCRDEGAQAQEVCERVLAAREQGMELREQAVLSRTSHDTDLLELELTRRRIPYVKYGGLRYLEAAHVKDFIALLRLADNRGDEISWFRVLQLVEGVGPVTARRALDALVTGGDGWTAAREHLPARARRSADVVMQALEETRDANAGVRAERLRDAIAPLIEARYPDGALRLQDLEHLVAAARESGTDLRHFVGELVLDPPQSSGDLAGPPHLDEDYLVLSTVHSA
jgi:DNA helicase-2/ATP-dependent DNA helicase PcrA